jgi:hypothetical protein
MNTKRKIISLLVLVLAVIGIFCFKGCLDIDRCLDSGGRWNYEKGGCEYSEQ